MTDIVLAGDRLRSLVERVERLEEEKRTIAADIKEVYAEAKGVGFDTKIMRLLIKERRMDKDDLDEQAALLDIYRRALGVLGDTPLGEAAMGRVSVAPRAPNGRAEGPMPVADMPAPAEGVAPANQEAQRIGREDCLAGHIDNAAKYPPGVYGHADYWIGNAQARAEREGILAIAREAGAAAGRAGADESTNPYPAEVAEHDLWLAGWIEAEPGNNGGHEEPEAEPAKRPRRAAAASP